MAQVTIAQLPPAGTANAADLLALWQGNTTKSVSLATLLTSAAQIRQGTFTPTLNFAGANTGITYDGAAGKSQYGAYIRIGNLVYVSGRLTLTSKGTATGQARIAGLPFLAAGANTPILLTVHGLSGLVAGEVVQANVISGADYLTMTRNALSTTANTLTDAQFGAATAILFAGAYITTAAMPATLAEAPAPAPPPAGIAVAIAEGAA